MECNKEEALRAKDIAERKLQAKDFVGARKFALKAQQLYPETENISQMICVCDVHCSAENKIMGTELDWYGILQIEHTADDALIKKQYRKLALLLHPDKNKFPGAESAFKLIMEAQKFLLDQQKRSFYDMKRKSTNKIVMPNPASEQTNKGFTSTTRSKVRSNSTSNPSSNTRGVNVPSPETFWTLCPFCAIRYQYYKEVLNRALKCHNCKKPFIAYDMHDPATRRGSGTTHPVFPQQDASHARAGTAGSRAVNRKAMPNSGPQAASKPEFSKSQEAGQSLQGSDTVRGEREQGSKSSRKANGKRGKKQVVESSESFESESSSDSEDLEVKSDGDILRAQQFDNVGDSQTRRSSRNKRHVSYNENASDEEDSMTPPKRPKGNGFSSPLTEKKSDASREEQPSKASSPASASICEKKSEASVESTKAKVEAENVFVVDSSPEITPEPIFHEYPDPEFCDFDKDREEHCFKVNQVWAAYDTVDAMPRFYARIRKVFSPGFKLRITWLEPDPDDEDGIKWANSELPFSCGKFRLGNSDYTEDRLMFSHEVSWEKGSGRDSIKIYPRKGETWALFKNWDRKWYQVPEDERKFEYQFVEVLSDYDETVGIRVAYLAKLKGFASLFCQIDANGEQILPTDVLRFAHKVPSFRMTGEEREGVPKGSFELDPASVTMKLEEISLSELETSKKSSSIHCDNGVEHPNHPDVDDNGQDVPDSEFFNFDGMKSVDKFQLNQVWALYSDTDGLPNYYGLVKKIDPHPSFKLHIVWLEACNLASEMVLWKEKGMPISCGQFEANDDSVQQYTSSSSFSHQLRADQTGRMNVFAIYPRKGDVWAIYKNWHPDMTCSGLKNCEYDIVEVLKENPMYINVSILERVHGFKSVFKPQQSGNSSVTREIPTVELLRFSHQIPSFKLTDEKGGSLRGYLELDPAALPSHVLYRLK